MLFRILSLEDMLFIYAKNNLAIVNIYIKVAQDLSTLTWSYSRNMKRSLWSPEYGGTKKSLSWDLLPTQEVCLGFAWASLLSPSLRSSITPSTVCLGGKRRNWKTQKNIIFMEGRESNVVSLFQILFIISKISNYTSDRNLCKRSEPFSSHFIADRQETSSDSIRTVGSCLELEYAKGGQIVTRRMDLGRRSVERLLWIPF